MPADESVGMTEPPPQGEAAKRPARLIDVAKMAGVSRATAARVLGGYSLVKSGLGDKVFAAAAKLNYRTNDIARAMRAGKTLTIGLVVADISNSFFSSAVRAVMDEAAASGYQTLIVNTNEDLAREVDAVRVLIEKKVDGLIVVPSSSTHCEHLFLDGRLAVPTVLLDRRIEGLSAAMFTTDDRRGAADAVDLLIARGHSRIALLVATSAVERHSDIRPADVVSTAEDRVGGAVASLGKAGLTLERDMLRYCRSHASHAREAALALLDRQPRPTALLATNEEMALGAISACGALGLSVGTDISLISFDDSPWTAVHCPAVSVIARPVRQMGHATARSLLQELQGNGRAVGTTFPSRLIERSSVRDLSVAAVDR